jgi:hypothetical protein
MRVFAPFHSAITSCDISDCVAKIKVQQLSFIGEESESEKPTQVINIDVENHQTSPCLSKDDAVTCQKEIGTSGSGISGVSAVIPERFLSESKHRAKRLFSRHVRDTMSKLASPSVRCEDHDEVRLFST